MLFPFRFFLLLALALPAQAAEPAGRYITVPASADGIGKVYLGREIAQVMGFNGAQWLERPERVEEEQPERLLAALELAPGMTVADVGAGTGYYSWRIAQRVGASGTVYAVDVQPEMVKLLERQMSRRGAANVKPVLGGLTDPGLAPASIDLALMVDVYHELEYPYEMLAAIVRALKPGGRLVLVEFRAGDVAVPIKPLHTMTEAQVRKEAAVHSLEWVKTARDLPWQNAVVFRKPASPSAALPAFPAKPVRFVVGFTPGGPSDILARALGQKLAERWSQQVVIDNRPGAGGNLAAEAVAKSAPDGYTWLLGNNSILATNQSLYRNLPYDPVRDFAPVALVAIQPNILVVHPSVPATSVSELIAYLKKNPGKANYASSGSGAAAHLAGELFKAMAGVDIVHVPYKGAQPALTDVIAGQVQMMFATSASVIPYIKAGRLRALAVTTAQRSASVPELPTVAEAGVPGFEATTWHGLVVPAATPAQVVQFLNEAVNAVLKEKDLSDRLTSLGAEIATGSPKQFADYIARETPKWAKVVKDSGARPE